jgi:hypothetical protein
METRLGGEESGQGLDDLFIAVKSEIRMVRGG